MAWRKQLRALAVHDWLVLGYLLALSSVALTAARPRSWLTVWQMLSLLGGFSLALWWVRRARAPAGGAGPWAYRFAIFGSVHLSYFFLGRLLPRVNHTTMDGQLLALDYRIFGGEPALLMDSLVTSVTTEWFSFFYLSYYLLLALHVLPIALGCRDQRLLGEFSFGILACYCVGQFSYLLVPGYGPYDAMAGQFVHALPQGTLHHLLDAVVFKGGAMMDIFPSLHTAAPTFIALYSWRHRRRPPLTYTWLPVAFFTVNIIVSTMFLRWHYLIDVVAGLLLAGLAWGVAIRVTAWESARRSGLGPSWPELPGGWCRR